MNEGVRLIGSFAHEGAAVEAIGALKKAGLQRPRVFAPVPSERIQHALGYTRSNLRFVVLTGGITGILSGFALTIGTALYWPHFVGGKPLISLPPFIIISFELMILCSAISGLLSLLVSCRFPRLDSEPGFNVDFTSNRYGVAVNCDAAQSQVVENLLQSAGAEEVSREAV